MARRYSAISGQSCTYQVLPSHGSSTTSGCASCCPKAACSRAPRRRAKRSPARPPTATASGRSPSSRPRARQHASRPRRLPPRRTRSSLSEHLLPKQRVVGSSPFSRSSPFQNGIDRHPPSRGDPAPGDDVGCVDRALRWILGRAAAGSTLSMPWGGRWPARRRPASRRRRASGELRSARRPPRTCSQTSFAGPPRTVSARIRQGSVSVRVALSFMAHGVSPVIAKHDPISVQCSLICFVPRRLPA